MSQTLHDIFQLVAEESVKEVIVNVGIAGITTLASVYFTKRAMRRARRDIKNKVLDKHTAKMGGLTFEHTNTINPETGNEFVKARNITTVHAINLEDIFSDNIERTLLDYIYKAAELCTQDEPIVFQHLHKVIPEEEWEDTSEIIFEQWRDYFSGLFNPPEKMISNGLMANNAMHSGVGE